MDICLILSLIRFGGYTAQMTIWAKFIHSKFGIFPTLGLMVLLSYGLSQLVTPYGYLGGG